MNNKIRKKGLGRGLSTLLAETNNDNDSTLSKNSKAGLYLPIEQIFPNKLQPRKSFDKVKLEELAKSILKNGIIQPVIVRIKGSGYELIAGERRWRAAQIAKTHSIPALVRDLTDKQATEYAIVENIQREDLNAIEEAKSYKNLMEIYNYTQEEVAEALGKSRSYIANMLRILSLPKFIINFLEGSKISVGHARALIGLEDPLAISIAKDIVLKNLSVRQTEVIVKRLRSEQKLSDVKGLNKDKKDIDTLNLEKNLSFQTKFHIKIEQDKLRSSGKLIFNYNNLDELDKICEFIYSK